MRIVLTFVAVAAAMFLASCDPTQEYKFYTQGIGTQLDSSTIAADTQLQNEYLSDLCEQAGLSEVPCLPAAVSAQWSMVVQSGMNDIDQRCDAFLGWLDEKRRNQEPILNELHTVAAATQAIMNAAGVGANPITIVGVAFGLASDTFTNVRSSLLLEVDKSTVETIVINAQNRYRQGLIGLVINNRATAVYALRSYLRICTPFTISNQINTTVTLVERGVGEAAVQNPMINAGVVRSTLVIAHPSTDTSYRDLRNQLFPNGTADPTIVAYVRDILGSPPPAIGVILNDPAQSSLRKRISACISQRASGQPCKSGSLAQFR